MAGIISTSGINGAGLKKCIPITRSACSHAEAIEAIEREDVLEARIQSLSTISSIFEKISHC